MVVGIKLDVNISLSSNDRTRHHRYPRGFTTTLALVGVRLIVSSCLLLFCGCLADLHGSKKAFILGMPTTGTLGPGHPSFVAWLTYFLRLVYAQ